MESDIAVGIDIENARFSAIFEHAEKVQERDLQCMVAVSKGCTMSFGSGIMTSLPYKCA